MASTRSRALCCGCGSLGKDGVQNYLTLILDFPICLAVPGFAWAAVRCGQRGSMDPSTQPPMISTAVL